ncbi:MAG: hypothetical protein GX242_05350 [Clostridiales bacterium]|jgi:hypothetical protein|nr:hypothetical protein [Clostridiales bacterium]
MAKNTSTNEPINAQENVLIPVKPATDNFRIPFVNEPSSFMMYGENALEQYTAEVKRVEAEILRELSGYTEEVEVVRDRKVNGCSIFAIILSILTLAMLVIGKFVSIDAMPGLFIIINGVDAATYIMEFMSATSYGIYALIGAIGIIVTAVFCLISLLIGIFTVNKAGTGIFMRICLFLSFTGAILVAVMQLVGSKDIDTGLYIVIGLTFLATLIGFISKGIVAMSTVE